MEFEFFYEFSLTCLHVSKINFGFLKRTECLKSDKKQVQQSFPNYIKFMTSGKFLPRSSKLINLSPILFKDGMLRIEGRVRHSNFTQEQIHSTLLPKIIQ